MSRHIDPVAPEADQEALACQECGEWLVSRAGFLCCPRGHGQVPAAETWLDADAFDDGYSGGLWFPGEEA